MTEYLSTDAKYLILTHKGPDGDAISSSLAMYTYLIDMGVPSENIEVYLPEISESLKFIDKNDVITNNISETYKDVVIIVDVSSRDRIEGIDLVKGNFSRCIVIDHHEKGKDFMQTQEAIINSEAASCTSIINRNFIDSIKESSNKRQFAELIVTGILSDTRGLTARNTTPESKDIIKQYKETYGINPNLIINQLETMDSRTNTLFELCKNRLSFKDGVMYTYLLQKDLKPEESNLKTINNKTIIQALIDNVGIGKSTIHSLLLLMEKEDGTYKGSTRTTLKEIDLSDECAKLINQGKIIKGGGHRDSSGLTINSNNRNPKQIAEDIIDDMFIRSFKIKRRKFFKNIKINTVENIKDRRRINKELVNQLVKSKRLQKIERA